MRPPGEPSLLLGIMLLAGLFLIAAVLGIMLS